MKRARLRALLAVLAYCVAISATLGRAASGIEHARIGGRDYGRLTDWAKANGFELRWLKRDETLELRSRAARISLTLDSREAEINGVKLWLLFPVAQQNGAVYLADQDLRSNLLPFISPLKNRATSKIRSICLDPGHGGKDPGEHVGSQEEKNYTLLLAQELRDQLLRAGFKVTMTRTTDTFIELPTRPELAKRRGADLFVSLHFNSVASSQSTVRGAEVYCLTPAGAPSTNAQGEGNGAWCVGNGNNDRSLFLAYQIQKSLAHNLGAEDRGVRRARFAVLRDAIMPAVLVEAGFLSHPAEGRKIRTAAYRRQIARAIVQGVVEYKNVVEKR